MLPIEQLLDNNVAWAQARVKDDPDFFNRLAGLQNPQFLWIGCSDSRVPANQITDTQPGEIFVHRNIANLVIHTDVNLGAVLDYAVNHLKVKDIIVCGHYGCGGVKAAMTRMDYKPILNKWLRNIKDVYRIYREELDAIEDLDARSDRLVELNVKEQVTNLAKMSTIQKAWKEERRPHLHGWAYGLKNGYINPILNMEPGIGIDPIYEYDDL
jgi:carbonic anhydrase